MTYRRPEMLDRTLTMIGQQTKVVDTLVVVDNGSDVTARQATHGAGATYLDAGDNLGPAGGIALGLEHVLQSAQDDDWVVLFDDDDPPRTDSVVEELWVFGRARYRDDPRTAAVGLVGARYDHRRGITRRVPDEDLTGPVPVDYIGGGQFPMFRCAALRQAGVFDRELFFGFDDLEHGLRLRHHGFTLYISGVLLRQERIAHQRLGMGSSRPRTLDRTAAWRRYYAVRNLVIIAMRYGSALSVPIVAVGAGARATSDLMRARRPASEWLLPIRGVLHGVRGRTGRLVDPGPASKTGS